MKYAELVLKHPIFVDFESEIRMVESFRIYCGHQLDHAMDVARLSWIYYLEAQINGDCKIENLEAKKDLFYTCALLHDIGRVVQYETGVHHSIAGLELAAQILKDIDAPKEWVQPILDVVAEHSEGDYSELTKDLAYYVMKADHDCRLCFACEARNSCKWSDDEMNHTVVS